MNYRVVVGRTATSFLGLLVLVAAVQGCERRARDERAVASATAAVEATAAPSATTAPPTAPTEQVEGCGVDHQSPVVDASERVTKDPKTGQTVTAVGAVIKGQSAAVTVARVLAEPEKFEGKTVVVEGEVTAMCGHRRGWFAIVDRSGSAPLRILTAPNFLVPKDAMTRRARAEGVVETREMTARASEHLSRDHGLPEARRTVLLRATGAEFR